MKTPTKKNLKCGVCGTEIEGKYLQADVDENSKKSSNGMVVCSETCAKKYEQDLPHCGKPMQHWSRITGYYQNVEGWNEGKKQELKDRKRYSV